jgi:hypothetical protein
VSGRDPFAQQIPAGDLVRAEKLFEVDHAMMEIPGSSGSHA